MDSTNCANHDDPLECTSVAVCSTTATETRRSASQNRHVTKSPLPSPSPSKSSASSMVEKRIHTPGKCYCSSKSALSKGEQSNKQNLYRTYSSFGFKSLNKNRSQSHRSLNENTSKDWCNENSDKKATCERKRYELAEYHRCMKLLGVDTNSRENIESSQHHHKILDTKKVKPKIITRLTSSTVSLEDVQDAVLNDFERTHVFSPSNRSFLAQAVYERWYFNKMQERSKQRREAQLKNELMRMEFERMRCEQKLKAEKSYQEWMEKKKKNKDSSPKSNTTDKAKKNSSERRFIPKNSEKEYVKWKTAKNAELEKKRHQWKEQKERENDEKQRKKIEAEKAYQAWKNKVSEDLNKKVELQRKREKDKKEQENRNREEKEKEAVTSFQAWKQNKLQQLKNKRDKQKFESKLKIEARTRRIAERLYEAERAFYEWLDSVDKRISSVK